MSNIEPPVTKDELSATIINNKKWAESAKQATRHHQEAAAHQEAGDHAKAARSTIKAQGHHASALEHQRQDERHLTNNI